MKFQFMMIVLFLLLSGCANVNPNFSFIIKTSPAAFLLKKASGVKKGTATCSKETVGSVTKSQVREIAEKKLVDLNAYDIESAIKIIEGTAKSMGIEIKED